MSATLFISLGTSPAIVPESFFLPGVTFQAVHVLTTEKPDVCLVQQFFQTHATNTRYTISRVKDFTDFTSETDHFRFEEVLYRWILHYQVPLEHRYICLSGGFKTMSAAMQKAAAVLGAAEVFHVLADNCCQTPDGKTRPPSTLEEILSARDQGHLHFIRLGPESGWPQFQKISPDPFPLLIEPAENAILRISAPDHGFRDHLRQIVERSHNVAGAWDKLPSLPFPQLATLSAAQLNWLEQPLDSKNDRDWVHRLPKIELHCHLGGFASQGELLDQVRAAASQPKQLPEPKPLSPPPGWPLPDQPIGLEAYMQLGNNTGSALLRDPGCLRKHCQLLYQTLVDDHVLYAEIRCSPNNYTSEDRSAWDVLSNIRSHFQACMDASAKGSGSTPACHINLLIIATRKHSGDRSDISRHLALAIAAADHWRDPATCRVVGVDLAGFEHKDTRAALFATDFEAVHRVGLAVTVHAGENDDAEGIWQAVFKLNARRLGHALHLTQAPDLLRAVADRSISVEMCPYANYQIKGFPLDPANSSPSNYPLLHYLRAGIPVTVNTDNLGISAATLSDNLLLAARLCPGLSRLDVLHLQRHALDAAFVSPQHKKQLTDQLSSQLIAHP